MSRPLRASRPLARATVGAVVGLLAAACTGSGGTDQLPTGTPSTSTTVAEPTSDTAAFDEQTAADLFVAWRDAIHGLPPTPADELDIEAAGAGIVVPGSPAARNIEAALQRAIDTGVLDRGDVHAEILGIQTMGDGTGRSTVCASLDVTATDLETGEPTQNDVAPITDYQRAEASYRVVDDTWRLEEVAGGDPQDCVPPSITQSVTTSWEAFTSAWQDWERSGGEDVDGLLQLVTNDFASTFEEASFDPASSPALHMDLQLHHATPIRVEGDWCRRGSLNRGVWELVQGEWLISAAGEMGENGGAARCG